MLLKLPQAAPHIANPGFACLIWQIINVLRRNRMPLPKLLHVLSGTLVALATATHAEKPINIAIYRGDAGCKGCSEMVAKSLDESGMRLKYNYIGEHEKLHVTDENLKSFDIYIQPGGGQDIPAAYDSLGDNGARAIRNFVKNGKGFIGLCMGAYLADKNWIGLINETLDSEVGRPHSGISDEGDYTINIDWFGIKAPFYYQDGPYFPLPDKKTDFRALAYYANGDIAMAGYRFGKGHVLLSGPHPEADDTWMDALPASHTEIPTAGSKMKKLIQYIMQ